MEDLQLIQMLKAGSSQAFDEIYLKYANQALKTAYLMTGNRQDSEDIVQETFIKVFLHIGELKNPQGFRSWFYHILTRTSWNFMEKRKREIPDEEIMDKLDRKDLAGQPDTLDDVLMGEDSRIIVSAIRGLEKKQAATVVLYYYNCLSTREIATAMKCREGTVKSRLFHARRKLKLTLSVLGKEVYALEESNTCGTAHP